MADFVAFKDVECVFPISGQYRMSSRISFYALVLFVIIFRRKDWLAAGAAATCMIYSGTAPVHAMALVPSLGQATVSVLDGNVTFLNGSGVAVTAIAQDLDNHGTIAILGAGLLATFPVAMFSTQFRHSGAVPALILWIFLLYVGFVCSVISNFEPNRSTSGSIPQYRFCSPGYKDTLPFSGTPARIINNNWNQTIWTYFTNPTVNSPNCIYPCLSSTYFLRQPGDIHVVKFVDLTKIPLTLESGSSFEFTSVFFGLPTCFSSGLSFYFTS
jgi:hypothetical protein